MSAKLIARDDDGSLTHQMLRIQCLTLGTVSNPYSAPPTKQLEGTAQNSTPDAQQELERDNQHPNTLEARRDGEPPTSNAQAEG